MPNDVVRYARNGPISTITLNRQEKFNTLRTEVRDGPFGDYSQAPASAQPRRRGKLKHR